MPNKTFNIFNKKKKILQIKGVNPSEDFEALTNQCKMNGLEIDSKQMKKAFDLVLDVYKDVLYYNHLPRYTHSLSVAMIIAKEVPLDTDSVIAAMLHDIWKESEKYDYDYINNEFGKQIADIIDGLHKIQDTALDTFDQPEKIENYRKILLALSTDFRVILVKLADTLENMRNISFRSTEEQIRLAKETFEIYNPFANRLGLRNLKWELDDLAFKIINPTEYKQISDYLMDNKEKREEYIQKFIEPIKDKLEKSEFLKKNKINFELSGRAKHIFSIYNKMLLRKKTIEELYDLFAIRVVIDAEDPYFCFYVYGLIASIFPPVPETFKDYVSQPKKNGYQSIHTAVFGLDNKIVEVQIRTDMMHQYSERGVAAHFKYKSHISNNSILETDQIQKWLVIVREIFENNGEENIQQLLEDVRTNLFSDEIYVYTPTNEFITLPPNSTPLDFAYKIHSDIGNHFVGSKVNGKMVPIDYRLRNGDKVEIITSNKAKPSEEWLYYLVSSKARNELNKFFKDEYKEKETIGRNKWNTELKKRKLNFDDSKLLDIIKEFNINQISDFYISISEDDIDVGTFADFVIERIFENNNEKIYADKLAANLLPDGNHNIKTFFRKQNDGNTKEIEKFKLDFSNMFKEFSDKKKIIDSEPILTAFCPKIKRYSILFKAKENYNLIKKISEVFSQNSDVLITKFGYDLEKSKIYGELIFETDDDEKANHLISILNSIEGIITVENG